MRYAASYEIRSEVSLILDGANLRLEHPQGLFKARIKNIERKDFSAPFRLSLQLSFDASSLEEAEEIGEERLVDFMNISAFASGASFIRHRTNHIIDCTAATGMRDCLVWADKIGHEDPQPVLDEGFAQVIQLLLQFETPPALRRALRWYRFGVNSTQPEDQFQYFWFALEILAEFLKSPGKVPSNCPECKSAMYCEVCKKHPTHRPYAKQAIRALIETVDKDCKEDTIETLDNARNRLMHGATLKEIEHKLPQPTEDIVDVLGKIVFKALKHQFPKEIIEKVGISAPNTYIHRSVTGIAHIQTVVQMGKDGEPRPDALKGTTFAMVTDTPPQSALPFVIHMSAEQAARLRALTREKTDYQDMCKRIHNCLQMIEGKHYALVAATDMARIQEAITSNASGAWQDFFREILTATPAALYRRSE